MITITPPQRKTAITPPARKIVAPLVDLGNHRAWYEALSRLTGFTPEEVWRLHYPRDNPLPAGKVEKCREACAKVGGSTAILAEMRKVKA